LREKAVEAPARSNDLAMVGNGGGTGWHRPALRAGEVRTAIYATFRWALGWSAKPSPTMKCTIPYISPYVCLFVSQFSFRVAVELSLKALKMRENKDREDEMGIGILGLAFGVYATIWVIVIVGSRFFGPR
jgi:hypothetical protein